MTCCWRSHALSHFVINARLHCHYNKINNTDSTNDSASEDMAAPGLYKEEGSMSGNRVFDDALMSSRCS